MSSCRLVFACIPALIGCEQILGLSEPRGEGAELADGSTSTGMDGKPGDDSSPQQACVQLPVFQAGTKYSVANATEVHVADIDHDGLLDLVANTGTSSSSNTSWLAFPGTGAGQFGSARPFGIGITHMVIVDVDNDGFNDVVGAAPQAVIVRRQSSAQPGSSLPDQTISLPGATSVDVEVGRVNGDTLPDLLVHTGGAATVYFGRAGAPGEFDPGPAAEAFAHLVDIDGDGLADLATQTLSGVRISFNRATAPGVFDAPTTIGPDSNGGLGIFGHLDGNAPRMDLSLPTATDTRVYTQATPRIFTEMAGTPFNIGGSAIYPALIADINGDGRDDVFADRFAAFQCPTPGTFYPAAGPTQRFDIGRPGVRLFADVDNNGKPDAIALTGQNGMTFNFIEVSLQ